MLDRNNNWKIVRGGTRTNGTLQEDWAIVRGYELPDVFGVIVRGHKGWNQKNTDATAKFALWFLSKFSKEMSKSTRKYVLLYRLN